MNEKEELKPCLTCLDGSPTNKANCAECGRLLHTVGVFVRPSESSKLGELKLAIKTVLEGFDNRTFLRNVEGDARSDFAIKLFPYVEALATLKEFVES